jgi:hypothetical protein
MTMKKIIFLLAFTAAASVCSAQFRYESTPTWQKQYQKKPEPEKKAGFVFDKRKLTFGGGIGLQFGDYTLVHVAPQVGYNFSGKFNAGAGFTYTYLSYDENAYNTSVSYNYFGFNTYARFYPIPYLILQVQPEIGRIWTSSERMRDGTTQKANYMTPSCLLGGGLRMGLLTAMLQYDIIQDKNSPYRDGLFYSVGISFSLP